MTDDELKMRVPHVCTLGCQMLPTDHLPLNVNNDELNFIAAIRNALMVTGRTERLADELSVSRPSIERWLKGRNLPAPSLMLETIGYINRRFFPAVPGDRTAA